MNIEAFFKVSYGLYIISAEYNGKKSGYVANTAFQVTAEPARFAISCSKNNHTLEIIRKSGAFSMSVLAKDSSPEIMGKFGYNTSAKMDKFQNLKHFKGITGSPIVTEECIAWFECKVEQEVVLDTHVIIIGSLVAHDLIDGNREPLTYAQYRDVRKGLAPKNAPTYIKKDTVEEEVKEIFESVEEELPVAQGDVYSCDLCGYEYDPAEGDPDNGIPPGTPFEDLPDDWVCPICAADKEDFSRV